MTPTLKRTKINWTNQESRTVALHTVQKLKAQRIYSLPDPEDKVGGSAVLEALREAQICALPVPRRRQTLGRAAFSDDFWANVKQGLDAADFKLPVSELNRVTAEKKSDGGPADAPLPPAEKDHRVVVHVSHGRTPLAEYSQRELMMEVAERLGAVSNQEVAVAKLLAQAQAQLLEAGKKVQGLEVKVGELVTYSEMLTEDMGKVNGRMGELIGRIERAERQTVKEPTAKVAIPKDAPRVAIVGCQKHLFDQICEHTKEHGLLLDMRHYDQSDQPRDVHADYAIIMKWSSHKWSNHVVNGVPRGQWTTQVGGLSAAVSQLDAWFGKG